MTIDAHQHFWHYDPVKDAWITDEMKVIQQDFLPNNLLPHLKSQGFDGCVAVQADMSDQENEFLLSLASNHKEVKGVVGWVDLKHAEVEEKLEVYQSRERLKGFRHIIQAEPTGFMTDKAFVQGVTLLNDYDFSYDILIQEKQLPETVDFISQLPEMRLVIDHVAKPNIKDQSFEHWSRYMKKISHMEHVYVKLSGLATEADWQSWTSNDFQPYIDFLLEHFTPNRLMIGSDWPVCKLAGTYDQIIDGLRACLIHLSDDEHKAIMGENATQFYKLN